MKSLFTFFLIVTVFSVSAQDGVIVKYYDLTWKPTSKENAVYYTHFIKEDSLYKCTSYYAKSNKLYGKSIFADTMFTNGKGRGLMLRYYENGLLHDSTFFDSIGNITFRYSFYDTLKMELKEFLPNSDSVHTLYHYFENGKLMAHIYFDSVLNKSVTEGFDTNGIKVHGYVYLKEAEFPGGAQAWTNFLVHHLKTNVPARRGARVGKYTVIVDFLVDKKGIVSDVSSEDDPGFGSKEEAIRVIRNSPKWIPAIQFNEPIAYRARQQITFVVQD